MGLWYGKAKPGDGRTQEDDDVEELGISDSAGQLSSTKKPEPNCCLFKNSLEGTSLNSEAHPAKVVLPGNERDSHVMPSAGASTRAAGRNK